MGDQWNIGGKKNKKGIKENNETAVLIGIIRRDNTKEQVNEYLAELEFLAETAGAITKKVFIQSLPNPNNKTFIGKGKLEEVLEYVNMHKIDMAIFDDDLTAKQAAILEEELKIKIIDRSTLILDIFASRAQTAQAKTQVELAQTQYMLPRLRGLWTHLERQRGGIGMRGPGEQEIETDRRIVRDKISFLKKKLEKIDMQNTTQRKNRGQMIRVSLVGYTNVGKSTLMNSVSKSKVFAENKLFATLDTTVRKVVIDRMPFLMSDTVGFIRKLPHHLVESFKSTLDEVRESDIIIHVVDIAHPQFEDHIKTVNITLNNLKVTDKPTLMVYNKIDLYKKRNFDDYVEKSDRENILKELEERLKHEYKHEGIFISALTKENLGVFKSKLQKMVAHFYNIRYPYQSNSW